LVQLDSHPQELARKPGYGRRIYETVMDWEQIVEMIDADQSAKKRGPYKKTG